MFLFRFFLSCCSRAANWGEVKNFSEVRTVFQISPTPSIKLLSRGDLIQFPFLLVSRSCSSCTHAQQLKFKPRVTWAIALSSLTFCFPALAFLFFVFSLIFDMFSGYWRAFFERGSCALGEAPALKSFVKGASLIQIDLSISVSSILLPVIFKFFQNYRIGKDVSHRYRHPKGHEGLIFLTYLFLTETKSLLSGW